MQISQHRMPPPPPHKRDMIPSWEDREDVLVRLGAAARQESPSDEQILIDSGRSEAGWSRIGSAFKCAQLYAWSEIAGYALIPADALTMGSMGHTMAAHWFAREGCRQGGVVVGTAFLTPDDEVRKAVPEDAVRAWVAKEKRGDAHITTIVSAFRAYVAKHPEAPGRVLGVEVPVEATLGTVLTARGPEWGLWLTYAPVALLGGRSLPVLTEITTLDCPGYPRHGTPIRITRRLDLVFQSSWGDCFVDDHKFVSHVTPDSARHAYAVDGGFRSQAVLASQLLPTGGATDHGGQHSGFAGVFANLVGKYAPYRNAQVDIPRSRFREERFARNLYDHEHRVAQLEVETANGE